MTHRRFAKWIGLSYPSSRQLPHLFSRVLRTGWEQVVAGCPTFRGFRKAGKHGVPHPCSRFLRTGWVHALAVILTLAAFALPASAEWKEQVLYSFQGIPDGATPVGGIVFDSAGNLYGATQDGGSSSCRSADSQCGTVFQLSPPAQKGDPWTETVLYVFKGNTNNDGAEPFGGLVIDGAGNLYGTAGFGGTGSCSLLGTLMGCGTVFELSPPAQKGGAWTETVLYSFQSGKDGYLPNGDLVFDAAGNLYGATTYGGGYGSCNAPYFQYCGTVFKLSPPKQKGGNWAEKVLHSFKGGTKGKADGDGANPNGGLVLDGKGAIYGTTYYGGNETGECNGGVGGTGCGAVFELTPPSRKGGDWGKNILHRFNGMDGGEPAAGVIFDLSGGLYGTTSGGGDNGYGLVYELKPRAGKSHAWWEKVLHHFTDGTDGADPMAGLVHDSHDNLYGTAQYGSGGSVYGTVFELKGRSGGGTWKLDLLYAFGNGTDGWAPAANLTWDKAGNLYSTTQGGGTGGSCGKGGCGTVFEVTP